MEIKEFRKCRKCGDSKLPTREFWYFSNDHPIKRCKYCVLSERLYKQYGITGKEYKILFEAQNGVCYICKNPEMFDCSKYGRTFPLAVDHCHKTGRIRRLLCSRCNRALGCIDDSIEILSSMIKYLVINSEIGDNDYYRIGEKTC